MVFGNASVSEILLSRKLDGIKVGIGTTTPALLSYGNEFTISGSNFVSQPEGFLNIQGLRTADGNIGGINFYNGASAIGGFSTVRSGADNSGRLTFLTNNAGTYTEKMTILPDGKVGIGTASPSTILNIRSATGQEAYLKLQSTDASGSGRKASVSFNLGGTDRGFIGFVDATANNFELGNLFTDGNTSILAGGAERMRITSAGNVGIGTTSPATTLDIKGELSIRSATSAKRMFLSFNEGLDASTIGSIQDGVAYKNTHINRDGGNVFIGANSSGRVGIGTTSPDNLLHINGATILSGAVSGGDSFLQIRNTSTNIALLGSEASMYSGATSSDVGLYVYGNNKLSLSTNATRRLVVDGAGNVGIGTTSPGSLLHVGSGTAGVASPTAIELDRSFRTGIGGNMSLKFYLFRNTSNNESYGFGLNSDAGVEYHAGITGGTSVVTHHGFYVNNTERMRIEGNGRVGIGTTAPAFPLHINATTTSYGYSHVIKNEGAGTGRISGLALITDNTDASRLSILKLSNTEPTNPGLGIIMNEANFPLMFGTNNIERIRILANGNVGIGTSSPAGRLHVLSTGDAEKILETTSTGSAFVYNSYRTATKMFNVGVGTNGASAVGTPNSYFINDATANVIRLTINTSGLVGINETTPTAQLQVKSGATDRVPLIVDTLASHGQDLQRWNINGSNVALVDANGGFRSVNFVNRSSYANSRIILGDDGANISRGVADSNPALIVNLGSASATGNIQVWQKAGTALSQISNAGIFVGQSRPTRTDITANATLALADEGKVLRVNPTTAADNITITVPPNGDVAFPVDTEIAIVRYNSGTVTIVAGSGVTIRSKNDDVLISGRYGSVALKKIGTDEWVLVGSLE
jgi:hypothetical protein